jgi:NADH-quinone oxidoreductase subunit M
VYATFFLIVTLSSIGLPLMNGFVGEFLILSGAFQAKAVYGVLAASGVIWSATYMLWMYQRVFYGNVTVPVNNSLPDLDGRERTALWPMALLALLMGVWPMAWMNSIDATVARVVTQVSGTVQATINSTTLSLSDKSGAPAAERTAEVSGR